MVKHRMSIGLLAAVAFAAASAAFYAVSDCVARTYRATRDWLGMAALKIVTGPEPVEAKQPTASLRGFVVHREHQRRQVKRQAPRIEDNWRMCPSV